MLGSARIMIIALATALLGLLLCLDAEAQTVTLAQFQHPKTAKDLDFNKTYLLGVADGLIAYNSGLDDKLFCTPGLVPKITFDQANDIVMRWARKTSGSSDMALGLALLYGLRDAYPCRQKPAGR
jgi:Rap1a immunity proteins